jgi:hypothetical protein
MPAKPAWYGALDEIIAQLRALPRPWVDRGTLEFLLGVGPRRAQQIMTACVTERVGSSSLADRDMLIEHLRALAHGDPGYYERRRRHNLAQKLEEMRQVWLQQPKVLVEAPVAVINQNFDNLPEGLELAAGCITVRFDSPRQALEKLLALAIAIGKDMHCFEQLTGDTATIATRKGSLVAG